MPSFASTLSDRATAQASIDTIEGTMPALPEFLTAANEPVARVDDTGAMTLFAIKISGTDLTNFVNWIKGGYP